MEQPLCRTIALEFLAKQGCMVIYCGSQPLSDAGWDMHLEQVRSAANRQSDLKLLVINEGGRPSKAQQARLAEVVSGHEWAAAVVSSRIAVRFIVSSLSLVKPNLGCFTPDQMTDAFEHLGIEEHARASVLQAIERLRLHVHPAHP